MKAATVLISFVGVAGLAFFGMSGFAQSQSVWLENLTTEEVQAAVSAGKTTAIFWASGVHQSGPAIALGKHMFVVRHVAQRVAEELGNALVLPIDPYSPSKSPDGDPTKKEDHLRFAGSASITNETFGAMVREVVTSFIVSSDFKNVMILGDHGSSGQAVLQKVAEEMDAEWKSKGAHIYYIPIHNDFDKTLMPEYLEKRKNIPGPLGRRQIGIDDASELMAIERNDAWVRKNKIAPDVRSVASAEVGKAFIDLKVGAAVQRIRNLVPVK